MVLSAAKTYCACRPRGTVASTETPSKTTCDALKGIYEYEGEESLSLSYMDIVDFLLLSVLFFKENFIK